MGYLENVRYGADASERAAFVSFAETELAEAVRSHYDGQFAGLYAEARPGYYHALREAISLPGALYDLNERLDGRLSEAVRKFTALLESRRNPLHPEAVRPLRGEVFTKKKKKDKSRGGGALSADRGGEAGGSGGMPADEVRADSADEKGVAGLSQQSACGTGAADVVAMEGAALSMELTRYERDPQLRRQCIDYHGCRCAVCGFDFARAYGPLGEGYIEVHHLRPISTWGGEEHSVDPRTDLMPLCANCHRMIHRGPTGVLSPDELRQIYREHNH